MGGGNMIKGFVAVVVVLLATVVGNCNAKSHVVGGSTGWTIPNSPSFYSTWASQNKLQLGDVLVFTFPAQVHTVAEVSKSNYDSCSSAATLGPVMTTAPANITLTKPGAHYFICTITGHCGANQKLTVTVAASKATTPTAAPVAAPTPAPKTSPTPSPAPTLAPAPTPTPSTSPTPSPSVATPAPTPMAFGPGSAPSSGPGSGPSSEADSPGGDGATTAPPPAGNFGAVSTGVSLLSLMLSIVLALALVF